MTTAIKVNSFAEALAEKVHNLGADTLKFAFTNAPPNLAHTQFSDLTEIPAGNGYTAGGVVVAVSSSAQMAGVYTLALDAATVSASGGAIGPFQYIWLYNDSAANKEIIGYLDYGIAYTLPDGQNFTINAGSFLTIA